MRKPQGWREFMNQIASNVRWTIRDVDALPDNEFIHYEIIDGELFVTRSPHHKHQHVAGRFFAVLDSWSVDSGLGEASIMPGLIFSDSDSVSPDVV
jgi:Uma2 family endonuclease